MKKYKLIKFTKGWVIGDFKPSLFRTKKFEVAVKSYKKGDYEKKHYHKKALEYTIIASGKYKMDNQILKTGDIILVEKNEAVDFLCLEEGNTMAVKIPSVIGDKYIK